MKVSAMRRSFAEYLVKKGVAFRTAHHIVGSLVAECEKKGLDRLSYLDLNSMRAHSEAIGEDVYGVLGAGQVVKNYVSHGAGGVKQLGVQLKRGGRCSEPDIRNGSRKSATEAHRSTRIF